MFQQSILDSLSQMGFGQMGWQQLAELSPDQIESTLQSHYELDDDDLLPGMFQTINPEMLQAASYSTYAPQVQAKGQSMLSDLYKNLGGQSAVQAAGNFAGSGQFAKQQAGVKDVYGKSMTDTLSNVRGQQSQGIGAISDMISQWNQMAQRIKGL
tara:strand:+ start:560 stop:1024 length:465 start_codon:yes stop_codon:yes gene_type:complete